MRDGMGQGRRAMMGGEHRGGMGGPGMDGGHMGMADGGLPNGAEFPVFKIIVDRKVREESELPERLEGCSACNARRKSDGVKAFR